MKLKCISEEKRCVTHVLKWSIYIVSNNFESCLNVRVYETGFFFVLKNKKYSLNGFYNVFKNTVKDMITITF